MEMTSPGSRSSSTITSVDVAGTHRRSLRPAGPVAWNGSGAAGTSVPPRARMVTSWRSCSAPARGAPRVSSADCRGWSGSPHVRPSNSGNADDRQYDSKSARTSNSTLSVRFVSRERMSTSGLSTSVTPPPRPRVSYSGAASAPGSRGPMKPAVAATMSAMAITAGQSRRIDAVERPGVGEW